MNVEVRTVPNSDKQALPTIPDVTIGFPVYNGGATLALALDSLLAQTFTNFEMIISDNGSTDGTLEICREYERRDARIRVIAQPKNQGPLFNFKAVLAPAKGRYFMWAAHDDIWMPRFIEATVTELERHPSACVCMGAVERFEQNGSVIDVRRFSEVNGGSANANFDAIVSGAKLNFFIYGMFRTAILQRAIQYFPNILGGDRLFMCQFALHAPFRYVDEVLYRRQINRHHEISQRKEWQASGSTRRQARVFGGMMLRSSLISIPTKLIAPYYIARYAAYAQRQAERNREYLSRVASDGLEDRSKMPDNISRRFKDTSRKLRKLRILAFGAFACCITLIAAYTGRIVEASALVLALTVIWQIRATRTDSNRAMLKVATKLDRMTRRYGTNFEIPETEENYGRVVLSSLRQLSNEVRQITDLELMQNATVLGSAKIGGNKLTDYVQNRLLEMQRHIRFAQELQKSRIRTLYAGEIFPDLAKVEVPVGAINELTGHPNKTDMIYVAAIAKMIGAKRLFEFGTYMGRTTYHLTQAADDAQVFTLNVPLDRAGKYAKYIGKLFQGTPREKQIHQIFEDSFTFDTTPMKHSFDFVFVDADHSYEALINDTRKAFELMRAGGIVMWHDYSPKSPGLVKAIREFTQTDRPLFRIRNTCLLLYIDGVDPMKFQPHTLPDTLEAEHAASDKHRLEEIYP